MWFSGSLVGLGPTSRFLRSLSRGLSFPSLPQVTSLPCWTSWALRKRPCTCVLELGWVSFPPALRFPEAQQLELSAEGLLLT